MRFYTIAIIAAVIGFVLYRIREAQKMSLPDPRIRRDLNMPVTPVKYKQTVSLSKDKQDAEALAAAYKLLQTKQTFVQNPIVIT